MENIAVRSVEVTEAWQEGGQDFVTVRFLANLLDYTVDETGTQVMEGPDRTRQVRGVLDVCPPGRAEHLEA